MKSVSLAVTKAAVDDLYTVVREQIFQQEQDTCPGLLQLAADHRQLTRQYCPKCLSGAGPCLVELMTEIACMPDDPHQH